MRLHKIYAVLLQEYYLSIQSVEVIMDIVFFPLMSIVVFGFLSLYLTSNADPIVGKYVISGMLLWQVVFIIQYSVSVGSLWNIWSRNLSNMFIAPLTVTEYVFAHTFSGLIKGIIILTLSSIVSIYLFHFNILDLGILNLVLFIANLLFFSFSLGVIILGMIFRFGTRIQAFAWGLLPMFQPLSAAFYPVNILPTPLQVVAKMLPTTYIFEASRYALSTHQTNWLLICTSFLMNIIYLSFAIFFFSYMFKKSRETGQFARNEG